MAPKTTLSLLRVASAATGALAVVQAVLAIGILTDMGEVKEIHGVIGMITLAVSVVAAVTAYLWYRISRNQGLAMHAIMVALMALAQVALGELESETAHISLGVFFLIAAVALATLAFRKPGEVPAP